MPGPIRIKFEGAMDQVMNRGDRPEPDARDDGDDGDCREFLETDTVTSGRCASRCL